MLLTRYWHVIDTLLACCLSCWEGLFLTEPPQVYSAKTTTNNINDMFISMIMIYIFGWSANGRTNGCVRVGGGNLGSRACVLTKYLYS